MIDHVDSLYGRVLLTSCKPRVVTVSSSTLSYRPLVFCCGSQTNTTFMSEWALMDLSLAIAVRPTHACQLCNVVVGYALV